LDLFCGAGGASLGLAYAGFRVTGVDIEPHPDYPFEFVQADAMTYPLEGFDFVWASPVCKRYSMVTPTNARARHPDQVAGIRARLTSKGGLWTIENVVGAPLRRDLLLCGRMFGLRLVRHRVFELSFAVQQPPHSKHVGDEVPVYGNGTSVWHRKNRTGGRNFSLFEKCDAMGIDWMKLSDLTQAIPPVYAEYIGLHAMKALHA
jgi:DNA (cytosine-5)-methyltransferase 1